jgi:anaerobic magnesium-protoporphyrin IX monomethyl ester cyclase
MKIYLLNPPFIQRYSRNSRWAARCRGGALYYPIWLSYAAGVLEKEGFNVRLVDAPAWGWNLDRIKDDITNFKPDIIVGDSNFQSLTNDVTIVNKLRHITESISIVVGPPTSQYSEKILNMGIDIAARLEYDFTLKEVALAMANRSSLKNILGISYKEDNKITHNLDRPFVTSEELDQIPFVSHVYKRHLDVHHYFLNHTLYPMVQIFTGRGCPNYCTFCSWPTTLMGREYRSRSQENVVKEFEYILDNMPEVREVFIEDDTFTINKKRVREICREFIERGLDIAWSCNSRANLDKETMMIMKKAGCRLLDVGYESGNDELLRNMKKGITVEQSRKFTKDAKDAGLMILADFIVGMPGENKNTAQKTLDFAKEIKPNMVQFSSATPIPGTLFYDFVSKNGFLETEDIEKSLDPDAFQRCIISYPDFTRKDIEDFINRALKEFYLSPNFIPIAISNIARKNGWHELKVMTRSAMVFLEYLRGRK